MEILGARDTFLWYKMLLKVVFDKTMFVKFKQNIDEKQSKQPKINRKIDTSQRILKISRKKSASKKSWDFCQKFVISQKKTIPYGMDLNTHRKSVA
jgi:hypothetical protein